MKFEYLFSDCDGVIIDSEIIAARVMVKYIQSYNVPITLDEYLVKFSGQTFSGIMTGLSKKYNLDLPNDYVNKITSLYKKAAVQEEKAIEGTKAAYEQIDLPKAIISNSYKEQINHAVDFTGMRDLFNDRVFSGVEDVSNPKPAPDIYLHTAKMLEVLPSKVIVIEDSASGAKSAVAAGMYVIGFTGASHIKKGHEHTLKEIGVKHVIQSMSELPLLIKKING
ncbi:HAD family hydrolase [Flammeovirga kamogawensis]|uniref:HAD-IA family hydrolase n=1 Tax=Flammeovirga kamogawensis TaxID=373891 RepID=A0ABX8GV20_9BACT|nr:HAD-IA family hydrolase [Flammeovirga kamogawensis]MBB6459952.1 HAD superfamily hydrolase (TIGR01509 family) [Flammeovirga kamogawensis]QWG06997.1 HAD-IA family hydrolase [Flammeovirga kamogawensis]TRX68818.1 HAD-IA family hydrolase [Flammeovirga kamogawensis]